MHRKVQTFVVNEIKSLFKYVIENYRQFFSNCLQTLNIDVSSHHISNILDDNLLEHCFSAVSSTYQLDIVLRNWA